MIERTMENITSVDLLPLEQGDRLTRAEFERRYHAMPDVKKAELIEGVVYMPSPARAKRHAHPTRHFAAWLGTYEAGTPGTLGGDNGTIRLDQDNEPQPDCYHYIEPECGGQVLLSLDDYVEGAPDLIVEIAASSASYDLGDKLHAYRRNGVREYIVWRVLDSEIDWFELVEGRYEQLLRETNGQCHSRVFPGLWLDVQAMLSRDLTKVLAVLQEGLTSEAHQQFVDELAQKRSAQ